MAKIVIIGAGSLVFSSRLTADILTYPSLASSQFALVDIDPERLDYAAEICRRTFREGGYAEASVTAETARREALKDADFVIISILVGGFEAIESEIDIPYAYGIDQCIGDTLTPGGVMRCLRTLPELLEIMADVQEICPDAHVLNYTNPMGMLSRGVMEAYPDISYVGLCHSVQGTSEEWAKRLDIPHQEINYLCAGINHEAWFIKFEHNGKDLLPDIRQLALKPEIWNGDSARMEYVKHFGYPVTESSGHVSEYSGWFRKNRETVERYCSNTYSEWNGGHAFIKDLYARPDWKKQMQRMASWEDPIDLSRSLEYGSQIVNSIVTGEPVLVYGNVRNRGYIENLPEGALVEVPCYVDKNGIQPVHVGRIPDHLAAINSMQLSVQELAVKAVQTRDPELVFQAMALDPLTAMSCTLDQIRAMTRELMQSHSKWIPFMQGMLPEAKDTLYDKQVTGEVERHIDPSIANQV
jgi:alpha-galactosidase